MARYYINPHSQGGVTYVTAAGVAAFGAPGTFIDTASGAAPLPVGWVPPPDCWTLWPCDSAAQTALQNSCATAKAAAGGAQTAPGCPGGFPASIPIWSP